MSKSWSVRLDKAEIDAVIKDLETYKRDLERRISEVRTRVGQFLAEKAQNYFDNTTADPGASASGGHIPDVAVLFNEEGNVTVVYAMGPEVTFIEFGAGVYHNSGAIHPDRPEGFTIGTYGKHLGSRNAWGYKDETGQLHITHGTPMQMPFYNAAVEAGDQVYRIAREVFGR